MGALLVAVALVAAAGEAGATTATYRSTHSLAQSAESIFRGFVLDRSSHWQDGWIVTDVLVAVDECWAGECSEATAVLRELGGEADGIGMLSPEPSALPIGEEVVVFARARGRVLQAVGGAQGVFRVDPSSDSATRSLASVAALPPMPEVRLPIPALRREVSRALTQVEEGR